MKTLICWYLVTAAVLGIFHFRRKWSDKHRGWYDRLTKGVALTKHEPSFAGGLFIALVGYAVIWASSITPPSDSEWTSGHTTLAAFGCTGFCLFVIFGLGANIAASPEWSRSYPLLIVYFAALIMIFARLYSTFGMFDGQKFTNDYGTGVYLSIITLTNVSSGDVTPSPASRFAATTEALIGYVALAFSAALIFTTIQRGMRSYIRNYEKLRRAREGAVPKGAAAAVTSISSNSETTASKTAPNFDPPT